MFSLTEIFILMNVVGKKHLGSKWENWSSIADQTYQADREWIKQIEWIESGSSGSKYMFE